MTDESKNKPKKICAMRFIVSPQIKKYRENIPHKGILIKQNNYFLIKNGKNNRAKFIGYESLTDERYSDIIVTISYFR